MSKKMLQAAAGNAGESLYVEDVFSTYLFTGTGVTNNIVNGIDLSGEGGLVWLKNRDGVDSHGLFDTERGVRQLLRSNTTDSDVLLSAGDGLTSFNSDGFTLGDGVIGINTSGINDASWTFRKAEKFFDVVTYTGTGSTTTISHNLGSTPGFIIVKRTSLAEDWTCYHTGVPGAANYIQLNKTDAYASNSGVFNNTAPTDSVFTVGSSDRTNTSGETYVAYLFASDAGGFGDDGSESIIKCGSYTGTGSALDVSLGFEPQWIMFKRSDSIGDWLIYDVMRGIVTGGSDERLEPNTSDAAASSVACEVTATGFTVTSTGTYMNASGGNYIYIAIRRPMKTPESGTEVFTSNDYVGNGLNGTVLTSVNDPVDLAIIKRTNTTGEWVWSDRLRGAKQTLFSNSAAIESTENTGITGFDVQAGIEVGSNTLVNATGSDYISYMLSRATGFFDVVAYTGEGDSSPQTINHNLNVIPELIIARKRAEVDNWRVHWPEGGTTRSGLTLNTTGAGFNGTGQVGNLTSESFDGLSNAFIELNKTYIAYLFATLAGVSKVGSYTGTGADLNVDCGFSAGARFILIKRTDSTGDWYVWDTERGIVAGNDPYLLLNSTAAEVTSTDYIDPLASGFTVTSTAPAALNASGGTYIYLAIA